MTKPQRRRSKKLTLVPDLRTLDLPDHMKGTVRFRDGRVITFNLNRWERRYVATNDQQN